MNQTQTRSLRKKVLSLILAVVMVVSLLPISAFASGDSTSTTASTSDGYEYNIMFLDCGRKYYSVDSIKTIIDNASAAGFNYIQLAVGNDGLRFLLDDMSLTVGNNTYDSDAVKKAIHNGNTTYNETFDDKKTEDTETVRQYNPDTNELTQGEMDTIIAYANSKGMGVIPCVNTPGHMDAILSAATSLTGKKTCSYNDSARTIDVTNDTAVEFTQALLQKYITYFAGKNCQLFNMGADEYANDKYTGGSMGFGNLQLSGKYNYYVRYVNQLAAMIKDAGMKPMAFNDGIYFNNVTDCDKFDTDIIICYWSSGWDSYNPMSAADLAAKGFKLINTNGSYYWVLGKKAKCDATTASGFNTTSFPGGTINNPVGSMFCIWADFPGAEEETDVINKTADTIKAFGNALPQIGIKSTNGTALTLNGSTELTVPGNAEATWTVSPAGVIELQASGNADERSAITGTSVVAKAVGTGTATVTATVGEKAYTTTLTVTDPNTVDVTVTVNGTKTVVVDGNVSGALDDTIATATTKSTPAIEKKLELVTTIESGEQYLIVHKRSGLVLNDAKNSSGLLLNGDKDTSNQLWTITKAGTSSNTYTVKGVNGNFITGIGGGSATLGTSSANLYLTYNKSGYWNIYSSSYNSNYYLNQYGDSTSTMAAGYTASGASDSGSQWEIYKVTPETKAQTTITFTGKSVGDTSVMIGDVTYKIHVVAEELGKVTPLKLEYWITNAPIETVTGSASETRNEVLETGTYKAYFTSITADYNTDVATEQGIDVTSIVPADTEHSNRTVYYWQCRMLDTTKANNSTTKTEAQTNDSGDDETTGGVSFTKIRYYNGNWQVFTENNTWVTVDMAKNQMVAYYLEHIKVSDEVESYAADWGNRGDGTKGGWLDASSYCTLSMQVVYEDNTTNPTGTTAADLKTKTIVYGYWADKNGRGIGTVMLDGQEYEIYKVTSETGEATASIKATTESNVYTADVTGFTWDKNETTVWEGDSSSSVTIHNSANGFSSDGVNANLCWDENKEAILLRVYVRAKVTEDSLKVNYYDESNLSKPFYDYNISVKSGTYFDEGFALTSDNKLTNNAVENIKGVTQTVQSDLSQMKQIDAQYRYSDYVLTRVVRHSDGKTVDLYYTFNSNKTFVVDFGLPVVIRPADMSEKLTATGVTLTGVEVSSKTDYADISTNADTKEVTYKLNKPIDKSDNFGIKYSGQIPGDVDGTQQTGGVSYSVSIIPATNVYYEDSLATFTNADSSIGVDKKENTNGYWVTATDGTTISDAKQALEELGGKQQTKNVYGYDPAYQSCSKFSMGSATKVTVDANTSSNGGQSPTATFTFKGTGFDVISLTGNQSGTVMYTVTNKTTKESFSKIVNTYYGYKFENDKWTTTDSADPNALYQIPVIREVDLKGGYGEYEVTISVLYGKYFNSTANDYYSFWLDAIRVYDPMGKNNKTYEADNEGYPQYIKLRDSLVSATATPNEKLLFIDGAQNAEVEIYKNYGPNNEVYLATGQAISFTVAENAAIATIQIGAKAPNGTAKMTVNNEDVVPNGISTATEMYYKLDVNPGNLVTISNTGEKILSLTNLKITFSSMPTTDASLAALTTEDQENAVAQVRALFATPVQEPFNPDRFDVSWSRNVRKGDTAKLTVKTSEDVEAITVNGETINSYVERNERTGWGWWAKTVTYREFTYTTTADVTKDFTVCAVNAAGVSSEAKTATLTVRPSVRDWLHGIIGKWF